MGYVYFGISFGITMVVSIYFGYQGGLWLDQKYATDPIFTLLGVLAGVFVSFMSLMDKLKIMDKFDKNKKK